MNIASYRLRRDVIFQAASVTMISFLFWLLLFALCWPLALIALVLYPFVWLITIPFRIVGIAVDGVFALLRAIVFLPARVFGGKP
jgi:hypothetical protein